ncbi:MAG: HAD-IB family phosphatase [Candidatus ainarchaeum sp.]|nr:HAD-IB family phosphatase [Candidatus ainarchaeum sp.]
MAGKSGAIFDVDGTLYKGYFIVELAHLLSSKGIFSEEELRKIDSALARYKAGKTPYAEAAKEVVEAYAQGIKGQSNAQVTKFARELVRKNSGNFFSNAKALVAHEKKRGIVAAVSLSPIECVSPLIELLGLDYVYGLWFRARNGKYTGECSSRDLKNFKQNAVGTIIGRFGLDPKKTKYFGDTVADLAMTRNLPIRRTRRTIKRTTIRFKAVNPDAELRATLRKQRRIKRR